jgi:hypothetical protein
MPYSLGDVLRTTAKTANATAVWKAYHDDPERRPLDKHSQCYEENCGFPPKDAKAVTGTPVALDEGGGSLVVVAMRTTTRRWPYAVACLLFSLLITTLVLSAVTLGRVADDGEISAKDCAAEVIAWRLVVADGAPPSDAVLLIMDDGTYRAHENYDGSGVGRTRPCLHLMHAELTKKGQTWPVATGRRLGPDNDIPTAWWSTYNPKPQAHQHSRYNKALDTIARDCHSTTLGVVPKRLTDTCDTCKACKACPVCSAGPCNIETVLAGSTS